MSGLRQIEPLPLPGVIFGKVKGAKPIIQWVSPCSLWVDSTYQRELNVHSMKMLRKMVQGFAWNRIKLPIVVETNEGQLHVIDGQHTAIAAATLHLDTIPVMVVEAETMADRAQAFVGHNTDRVVVSPINIYRALLSSGDEDAVEMDKVCAAAGVRIRAFSPSSVLAEGDTSAVGTIKNLMTRRGPAMTRQVLSVLVKAKCCPLSSNHIIAVEVVLCELRRGFNQEALSRIIRTQGDNALDAATIRARKNAIPRSRALAEVWLSHADQEAVA